MSVPFGASWFCNLGVSTIWNLPQASTQPPTFFTTYQPQHTQPELPVRSWSPWVDLLKLHLFKGHEYRSGFIQLWTWQCWSIHYGDTTLEIGTYLIRGVASHGAMSSRLFSVGWWRCVFFGGGKIHWKVMPGRDGSNPMGLGFWWQMMGMWGGYFSYSYEFFDVVTILCTCTVILRVDIWNCLGGPFWKCERFAAQWEYIYSILSKS